MDAVTPLRRSQDAKLLRTEYMMRHMSGGAARSDRGGPGETDADNREEAGEGSEGSGELFHCAALDVDALDAEHPRLVPDRCFICFDLDYFYCQVELLRHPELRGKPVGVTQKYLVVTCNYEARHFGVGKLMGISEALRLCPHLVLVNGEDLSPYRAMNEQIVSLLREHCGSGAVETIGLDEMIIDCSRECAVAQPAVDCPLPSAGIEFEGFVYRHVPGRRDSASDSDADADGDSSDSASDGPSGAADEAADVRRASAAHDRAIRAVHSERVLARGSVLAARLRTLIRQRTGLTCSAGVAHSKMLAKLVLGLHKPDAQTSLPLAASLPFLRSLPLGRLPGIGAQRLRVLLVRYSDVLLGFACSPFATHVVRRRGRARPLPRFSHANRTLRVAYGGVWRTMARSKWVCKPFASCSGVRCRSCGAHSVPMPRTWCAACRGAPTRTRPYALFLLCRIVLVSRSPVCISLRALIAGADGRTGGGSRAAARAHRRGFVPRLPQRHRPGAACPRVSPLAMRPAAGRLAALRPPAADAGAGGAPGPAGRAERTPAPQAAQSPGVVLSPAECVAVAARGALGGCGCGSRGTGGGAGRGRAGASLCACATRWPLQSDAAVDRRDAVYALCAGDGRRVDAVSDARGRCGGGFSGAGAVTAAAAAAAATTRTTTAATAAVTDTGRSETPG